MPNPLRTWFGFKVPQSPAKARASPIGQALVGSERERAFSEESWSPTVYGQYYATSVPIYSAVKQRADAVTRPTLVVATRDADGKPVLLPKHPLQTLLDKANDFWAQDDVLRATSTYLDLWGVAFWVLEKAGPGAVPTEIWPVRPDKMKLMASTDRYVAGFEYRDRGKRVPLRTDEVVWFRYFNPLDEWAGFSPVAPVRLSADMGIEALRHNRESFRNRLPIDQLAFEIPGPIADQELADFQARLQKRYGGVSKSGLPLVLTDGAKAQILGFTPKDLEHLETMRWTVEDVSAVYGVPAIMLGDLSHSTYANIDAAERIFWRNIATHCHFLAAEIMEMLAPQFGQNLEVEFDLSQIEALQPNIGDVEMRLRENVKAGLMTPNEARQKMSLPAVTEGDVLYVPIVSLPVPATQEPSAGGQKLVAMPVQAKAARPKLTPELMREVGEAHVERVIRYERKFRDVQRELFDRQRLDVLRRLREAKAVTRQAVGDLFDPLEWQDAFVRGGRAVVIQAILESARAQILRFGLGISFDITAPSIAEFVIDRLSFWAKRTNEETASLLMSELIEAHVLGESIRDIQARVEKVFKFNAAVRSERIARTEMNAAANRGAIESYRQSGVVEQKVWLATMDDRVRDAHAEADGQQVPLEAPFTVGGERIMQPGDGSPEVAINCRCTVAPVVGTGITNFLQRPRQQVNGKEASVA